MGRVEIREETQGNTPLPPVPICVAVFSPCRLRMYYVYVLNPAEETGT